MSDVRKPNSERAEPGIGAYLVVTEVGKPHSEWAEPGIGRTVFGNISEAWRFL